MKTQVGSCPQCGAPIYVPTAWWATTPPPNEYTCICYSRSAGVTFTTNTTGTGASTPTTEELKDLTGE